MTNTTALATKSNMALTPVNPPSQKKNPTSSNHDNNEENHHRVTYKQLCQAAAGSCLETLKASMIGWTALDIDQGVSGKSALHMAAWKGSLANVQYLIEEVGCDVNAYSTGQYSYGKTAIFFAATQSRADIIQYLLTVPNIKVTIVNNKGQSVLSICASHHMPHHVMETMQQLVQQQEAVEEWWNFRQSHSDGLEYGDLEPKFLERPLRDTDVVTKYAINPTTRASRKGAFARRNKNNIHQQRQSKKQKDPKKKPRRPFVPPQEALEKIRQHEAWQHLSGASESNSTTPFNDHETTTSTIALIELVAFSDQYKCAWISVVADKLVDSLKSQMAARSLIQQSLASLSHNKKPSTDDDDDAKEEKQQRIFKLLEKLLVQVAPKSNEDGRNREDTKNGTTKKESSNNNTTARKSYRQRFLPSLDPWNDACSELVASGLDMTCFASSSSSSSCNHDYLTLPEPPIFVNTLDDFLEMQTNLNACNQNDETRRIMAIDTEWYDVVGSDTNNNDTTSKEGADDIFLSTLQIAFWDARRQNKICTYIVDLMTAHCHEYLSQAQAWIQDIFESSHVLILGFAIGNDLPHLERFCGRPLHYQSILDLQLLLIKLQRQGKNDTKTASSSSLPGLKACVSWFTEVPLSKEEQCSNWAQRPLTMAQLKYAGMDAAILLVLLAEYLGRHIKGQQEQAENDDRDTGVL